MNTLLHMIVASLCFILLGATLAHWIFEGNRTSSFYIILITLFIFSPSLVAGFVLAYLMK